MLRSMLDAARGLLNSLEDVVKGRWRRYCAIDSIWVGRMKMWVMRIKRMKIKSAFYVDTRS